MWISRKAFKRIMERLDSAEKNLQSGKEENREFVMHIAKKILLEPDKLKEEIAQHEECMRYIEDIIRCP